MFSSSRKVSNTKCVWCFKKQIQTTMHKIETKITTEKINETKSWFFEKINKIDKLSQTH